jgi:hypothetical protein
VSLSQMLEGRPGSAARPAAAPPRATSSASPPAPVAAPPPAATDTPRSASDPVLDLRLSKPATVADESLPVEPWERFLAVLRKKAPWAASELKQGRLESHNEGQATFYVPESNPFNRDRFSSKGIRSAVEEAFKAVWGEKPAIEFRFGESSKSQGDQNSLLGEHPELAQLMQATDGEIVARRPRKREG